MKGILSYWEPIAVALLLLFGVWRMIGTFGIGGVDWNWPVRFLAFSPNPSPFLTVRVSSPAGQPAIRIVCKRKEGSSIESQWGPELRGRMDGPQRVIAYYSGVLSFLSSNSGRDKAWQLLRIALCGDSSLSRATGCGPTTESVLVEHRSTRGDEVNSSWRTEWNCP